MADDDKVVSAEEQLELRILQRHEELVPVLENTAASISSIAKLMAVTPETDHYFERITKVAIDSCTSFDSINGFIADLKATADLMNTNIPLMVGTQDATIRKENNTALHSKLKAITELAKKHSETFDGVTLNIHEILMDYVVANGPFEGEFRPIAEVLINAMNQMEDIKERLLKFENYINTIISNVKIIEETLDNPDPKVQQQVTLTIAELPMAAFRVTELSNLFSDMAGRFYEPSISELKILLQNPTVNREALKALAEKSVRDVAAVKDAVAENKILFTARVKAEIEKQGETVTKALVRDEKSNDLADDHRVMEGKLIAAPLSVLILSRLCLLSTSTKDFELAVPIGGLQLLKFTSFRATLHQVINTGSTCFATAKKNLDQIESHTKQIPDLVLQMLEIILSGDLDDIESMLPGTMESVIDKATKCTTLSAAVDASFESMISLINEMALTYSNSRSTIEAKLFEALRSKGTEVDPEEVKKQYEDQFNVLNRGIQELGNVRQQWAQLVQFFQKLASTIRIEMSEPLEGYKARVAKKGERILKSHRAEISEWARTVLQARAKEVAEKGFEVNVLTTTYLTISKQYLQAPLSALDELLTLTPEKDGDKLKQLQQGIVDDCRKAQEEIAVAIPQHREDKLRQYKYQLAEIETTADQVGNLELNPDCNDDDDDCVAEIPENTPSNDNNDNNDNTEKNDNNDSTKSESVNNDNNTEQQ